MFNITRKSLPSGTPRALYVVVPLCDGTRDEFIADLRSTDKQIASAVNARNIAYPFPMRDITVKEIA